MFYNGSLLLQLLWGLWMNTVLNVFHHYSRCTCEPDNMVAKWRLLKLCLKWFTVNPVPASLWQFEYLPWVFWQPSQYFLSILSSRMGFEGFLWLCIPLKEDKLVYNSGRERSTKSSFSVRLHIFTSPSLFLVFPALSLSNVLFFLLRFISCFPLWYIFPFFLFYFLQSPVHVMHITSVH